MSNTKKVLVIAGPTAVGKSSLGMSIAKRTGGEIVSADSVQVYKYLDIGSAKPTKQEQQEVVHHMIDLIEPDEKYSVALYAAKAKEIIRQLLKENKLPIVVGGTGLYINALAYPMDFTPADIDQEYRDSLQRIAEEEGNGKLMEQLKKVDPVSAQKIMLNDTKRLIRALEVYHITKRPMSSYVRDYRQEKSEFSFEMFGLTMPREQLYQRINKRVDQMMAEGLLEEANALWKRYPGDSALQSTIGYKQLIAHFQGELSLEEAVELIKRDTRRFAKRQFTWFRRDERIHWEDISIPEGIEERILDIIQR